MDSDELNKAQELTDEQLKGVAGGQTLFEQDGRYYEYVGSSSDEDWNASYLCPNCGRPVHYGDWFRFYCDPCDESWLYEDKLRVNTASKVWKQISWGEYKQKKFKKYGE